MTTEPIVRRARMIDAEAVANILAEGFQAKFVVAFRERADRAARVLARTMALEVPRGLGGIYVAEVNGQVAGTLALRRKEDPELPAWPALSILFEELGFWGGLRAAFYLSLAEQPFDHREVYVSDVAVSSAYRRRGVGQALLAYAEGVARSWHKEALVLDVETDNEAARNLYLGAGYVEQRVRRSLLSIWLTGKGEWVRMRKKVSG